MDAPQTLRRPANWQDFENLCKELWGEIWNCPEIQKNGRIGQEQFGVDIFGCPFNEDSYFGIQCKGKNEYTHNQFTKDEIVNEIEKAKLFQPPLKKLYFATTALNDSKIQEFVRIKNLENKKKGLFEVHLFCWESIVDLIDRNKHTHDWYLKNQNYKTNKSILVTFENGLTELVCEPKFKRVDTHYTKKHVPSFDIMINPAIASIIKTQEKFNRIRLLEIASISPQINLSFVSFRLVLHNTGNDSIEQYKVFFDFDGDIQELADKNETNGYLVVMPQIVSNTFLYPETKNGKLIPNNSILVGDDTFKSKEIFVKPLPEESTVLIKWKLISKDFKDTGELKLIIKPKIEIERKFVTVDSEKEVRIETGEVQDCLIAKDNKNK
jgi:hypothetical protein